MAPDRTMSSRVFSPGSLQRFEFLLQIGMAKSKGTDPELFRQVVEEMAEGDPDDQIKEWAIHILKLGMLRKEPEETLNEP